MFFVWEMARPRVTWQWISTAVAAFFFFGKFVILGGSITVVAAILYLLNYRYRQLKERQT